MRYPTVVKVQHAAALAILSALGGCGFHLQGADTLPPVLAKTYVVSSAPHSDFVASVTDALRVRGATIVGKDEPGAAQLNVTADDTGQRVLSVSARNIPREYEVYYSITFSLQVGDQKLIQGETLVVSRSYTFDETQVLAKASEEEVLRRALADDLARRVVRRIEGLSTAPTTPSAPEPAAAGPAPPGA
ncbi:MAG TPA: LPS assembly lipoprotein LptE [Gammaproteobacteria bacterium]|nr:LPS assembly lipoprotein LptE [Gammaproteobacteria bacterium]